MDYMRLGRKYGVSIWVASQSAVDVHADVRRQCVGTFVFKQEEQLDADKLNKIKRGLGDASLKLPYHWYYYVSGGEAKLCSPMP
jgi:DNA helicase HerA-like ATPase